MTPFSTLQPPFISQFDPSEKGEVSADPLSLQRNYERLAERIYPHFTVRMRRARFLTAIAVGARVCQDINDNDEELVTPSWLGFEWYVMEAFGRQGYFDVQRLASGFPGSLKVRMARKRQIPLSPGAYLKSPKVFGYTGVHKRLAIGLGIVNDRMELEPAGYRLLEAWELDQRLPDFQSGSRDGNVGAKMLRTMESAVRRTLDLGYTQMNGSQSTWLAMCDHLDPDRIGKRERDVLAELLLSPVAPKSRRDTGEPLDVESFRLRAQLLELLIAERGLNGHECKFIRKAKLKVDPDLRERLAQIEAYEAVAFQLDTAFRCLLGLARRNANFAVTRSDFASAREATKVATELPTLLSRLAESFVVVPHLWISGDNGSDVDSGIGFIHDSFAGVSSSAELFDALTSYHEAVQRAKLPDGRRPWFDRIDEPEESVGLRPSLVENGDGTDRGDFIHDYRSRTAAQFLKDVRRF